MIVSGRRRRPGMRAVLAGFAMTLALPGSLQAREQAFDAWLAEMRVEARSAGISESVVNAALHDGLAPLDKVIKNDRNQPMDTLKMATYLEDVVNDWRVRTGRQRLAKNRALLERIAADYGVQPRFIVALWGVETAYGEVEGDYSVIGALATLAYDERRSAYFRGQLMAALRILDRGHITLQNMTGSWAGAMGQNQFMPSSYLSYAVDYNDDGRKDIWSTKADIFASAANYLSQEGWRYDETWGRRVKLPQDFDPDLIGRDRTKPLAAWSKLGVRRYNGQALPEATLAAAVIAPDGVDGPAFVGYNNYRTLLDWNRSDFFAVSVGVLSDKIAGRKASG